MKYFVTLLLLLAVSGIFGQNCSKHLPTDSKPPIDTNAISEWCSVRGGGISDNGNYILYTIVNEPIGSNTLVVKSTRTMWEIRIVNGTNAAFLNNDHEVIYNRGDSICLLELGGGQCQWL